MKNYLLLFLIISLTTSETSGQELRNQKSVSDMENNLLYIGTYTKKEGHVNGQAKGIYSVFQNPVTGELKCGATVAKITNPSFVKSSKDHKYLYAVSELGDKDGRSGYIYSYKINEDSSLKQIGKISTESYAPCHIAMDQTGKFVFVSNYVGGVVMVYRIEGDGTLKKVQRVDLENRSESNAHSVNLSADNTHAYIADLGNDKIWIYDFSSATGKLKLNKQAFVSLTNGSGPRHFTFGSKDKFAYSINEINSTVSVFEVLKNGGLKLIQNVTSLPDDFFEKNSAADIQLHPSGKFLYVSNRGHNSISSYKVDKNTGKLKPMEFVATLGETPRNFSISLDGKFLYVANQDSNSITTFEINSKNGKLTSLEKSLEIKTPVSIEFID